MYAMMKSCPDSRQHQQEGQQCWLRLRVRPEGREVYKDPSEVVTQTALLKDDIGDGGDDSDDNGWERERGEQKPR